MNTFDQQAARSLSDTYAHAIQLPLVSVVVVNYNYARYIEAAVASVYGQTYPHTECIIVDDLSTDDSPAVFSRLAATYSDSRFIRRETNGGQTMASLDGLAAARGQYVIFLDADDMLLPHCIESHVFAHLSMRRHVGFTSGDMLQVVDDQIVVSTGSALNSFMSRRSPAGRPKVRPYRHPLGSWPDAETAAEMRDRIYVVPVFFNRWVWAPTSGNCYRRDALLLFADNPGLSRLRTCTDMYFSHAIGALCGSVLIDKPLFAYRIHGGNALTRRAQLQGVSTYDQGGSTDNNDLARRLIIDQLVAHLDRFASSMPYWIVCLIRLSCRGDEEAPSRWARRSQAASALVAHHGKVAARFGGTVASFLCLAFRVPPTVVLRIRRQEMRRG